MVPLFLLVVAHELKVYRPGPCSLTLAWLVERMYGQTAKVVEHSDLAPS